MARTSIMRAQHDHAEKLFDELFERIDRFDAAAEGADAYSLSLCLAKIAGVLRTHFAIEEGILYPALIASENREVAVMARVFEREMGHLADQLEHFLQRWGRSAEIAAAIPQFRYECGMMFSAIRERIHRENRELYPVADRISRSAPSRPAAPAPTPVALAASRPFEGFVLRSSTAA